MLKKAFTLIELLVVIAIIGILITVGSVSYTRAVKLSRDARRKTDLEQIRQALETFRSESATGIYPANKGLLVPTYITTFPLDPKENATFTYTYTPNGTFRTYSLCATTESPTQASLCVKEP